MSKKKEAAKVADASVRLGHKYGFFLQRKALSAGERAGKKFKLVR